MTKVILMPRLNNIGVTVLLQKNNQIALKNSDAVSFLREHKALISFGPSGGTRAGKTELIPIKNAVTKIAIDCGFPDNISIKQRAEFDKRVAIAFADIKVLDSGEAFRNDVWAFLTCVLLLNIASWRFSSLTRERLGGGARNTFQRLWVRSKALDLGASSTQRWKLINDLSEDAMVQIFERASIASNSTLARQIAIEWTRTADRIGKQNMEKVMRAAMKLIMLRKEIVDISTLSDEALAVEINKAFKKAIS